MVKKLQQEYELAGLTINMRVSEYFIVGCHQTEDLVSRSTCIRGVQAASILLL